MNTFSRGNLPLNPYRRSPIKRPENLAGRAQEKKRISYYLGLTAGGDSPHLALIGDRGIGKTSLLNAAEILAKDEKLLPVRIDLNQLKARSPGRFWHDLYLALSLTMARAGCWGGEQGRIYEELLRMMHSRNPGALENAVMQIPYLFSCHQGDIDDFECPDALVVHDLRNCVTELSTHGRKGIAFLIDEADCLGSNVPLLQMFRNIFQIVDRCSLVLSGTPAIFPALTEVFSPIPRQFYRITVEPFARWSDTMELIHKPMPIDLIESITPKLSDVRELHRLCGGSPDEIQLYCHHMYRAVEDGSSEKMSLSPQVFREVLREYRSSTPANVEAVLNSIERLPDKLLYRSRWLSRTNLTVDENIRVSILRRELQLNRMLTSEEQTKVASEIREGYKALRDKGIIEVDNRIQLCGAPHTAGFWKSFVEVEKSKRWSWSTDPYDLQLMNSILLTLGNSLPVSGFLNVPDTDNGRLALTKMRSGEPVGDFDFDMSGITFAALMARDSDSTHGVDISTNWETPAGSRSNVSRFIESPGAETHPADIHKWLDAHKAMLASNDISIDLKSFSRWELPTSDELHHLSYISAFSIPDVFGPAPPQVAVNAFLEGKVHEAIKLFTRLLTLKDNATIRNNLGFCQLIAGDFANAFENTNKACALNNEPLFVLNKGIAAFLSGDESSAKACVRDALTALQRNLGDNELEAVVVLVLNPDRKSVSAHQGMRIETAALITLWRMGDITREQLESSVRSISPSQFDALQQAFP